MVGETIRQTAWDEGGWPRAPSLKKKLLFSFTLRGAGIAGKLAES